MSSALVSVLIPTYNSVDFIRRALNSVVTQTHTELEIIVSDNASSDATTRVVAEFAARDRRISLFENATNLGPLRNWQEGLRHCRGDFIKIVWSDDWLEPTCIEESVARLEEAQDCGFVFTATIIHEPARDWCKFLHPNKPFLRSEDFVTEFVLFRDMPVSPGCVLLRRADAIFAPLPGTPPHLADLGTNLGAGPDMLFHLRTTLQYPKVAHIPKFLAHFDYGKQSITRQKGEMVESAYRQTAELFVETFAIQHPGIKRRVRRAKLARAFLAGAYSPLRRARDIGREILKT
jgi:hypothetical protein